MNSTQLANLGRPIDYNVVENGPRDWGAMVIGSSGRVHHERVPKSNLTEFSSRRDQVRFYRHNPDTVCVQIREETKGETVLLCDARMPVKQFLALAWSFIESLPDVT